MEPSDLLREQISRLSRANCIYMDSIAEVLNAEIKPENLGDLETLINLYEMHEEALKETKRTLMLKQQTCIMGYLTAYARDFKLAI